MRIRTLRAATAAVAITVGLTAGPPPAHAFLGGLLNSFFGGGGGGGCFSEKSDGLFGTALSAVVGYVTGGPAGAVVGAGSSVMENGTGGGNKAAGCPIVESRPRIVEEMVQRQEVEIIAQTAHMLTQIDNMVRMRALSGADTGGAVAARLSDARRAAGMVERVLWSLDGVGRQFADLYPDALPEDMSAAALAEHQAEQARLARAASRASKLVSADVMTGVEDYPARARDLMAALKACQGQTCAIDAGTQATLLNAEMAGQLLMMQAAHYRAAEAQLDYEQAAVERARQHTRLTWRGLDTYTAPGS
ncbi:hypothetical protein [Azospirillum rugosum]|uniref:Conjugal transfer/entry exclusion protein n=1 Tax=Azospirillum rugosum TaxID=416170 RepID=A0ABS4SK67_9PROT|nr:hypothetical protein [Azospirillum rugosum]MBP2292949.1 conjugal transfer/entry exclusion protein [Azospirillum rugosum]MDQ0526498.1 conjugal transfer/entry exclusion protein [Azospirillum rugosum]